MFVTACSSRAVQQAKAEQESNARTLGLLYGMYASSHQGQGPADEGAFREFVKGLPAERRSSKDAEGIFTSDRDGQPIVVLYGALSGPAGPGGFPVCLYEQQGKNGKRFVASSLGAVEEVDEARFRQLVPGAK